MKSVLKDLTGMTFGRWTVLSRYGTGGSTKWLCRCSCGKEKAVYASHLCRGKSTSCGCLRAEQASARQKMDLTGKVFNELTVIKQLPNRAIGTKYSKVVWLCRCSCGAMVERTSDNLLRRSHGSKNCGGGIHLRYHRKTNWHLHGVWKNMLARCEDENCAAYRYYGGRGISVCGEWHDYEKFVVWAEASGYEMRKTSGLTLDRKDNSLGYSPDNCWWTNMTQQVRNRRNTITALFEGKPVPIAQLAERFGLKYGTVANRYRKGDTTVDRLIRPLGKR